jgi:hypothetical protein
MISESTEDSFYITLASNGNMNTYSNNSPSHFLNNLKSNIHLNNPSWKVGLSEIHIPLSCHNVLAGENIIWFTLKGNKDQKHKITPGYYVSIQVLVDELNKITPTIQFRYSNTVQVSIDTSTVESVYLSPMLALQLGFEPKINLLKLKHAQKQPYLNIGYPHQIFVYTDIIEPQFVGDTKAPLLRIVAMTDSNHGKVQSVAFENVHYFPLCKLSFDTIEILLKDHAGRNLPFAFGTLTVTLHFKRSSL